MNKISWGITAGIGIVCAVLGMGFGYFISPEYRQTMYARNEMDFGASDRWVDLRYINAMISHHRAAMLLADQAAANSDREEIRTLASEIQANEPKLIAELYEWKKSWYGDSRSINDPSVAALGAKDKDFDLRFLNALIAHHEAGVAMAREIRTKSSRQEIVNNGNIVDSFLSGGITMLKDWRKQWYNL